MRTFDDAQKFYSENKNTILETLLEENVGEIDIQDDFEQIAVWFKNSSMSICYQNGDMNGDYKGEAVWWNEGAKPVGFLENLQNDDRFCKVFAGKEETHFDLFAKKLVDDFCREYEKRNPTITKYFVALGGE